MSRAGWIGLLLGWGLLVPATARGAGGGEIAGVVREASGAPAGGADVVVVARSAGDPVADGDGERTAVVTDAHGAFVVPLARPGTYQVTVFTESGARVQVLVVELPPGGRVQLDVGGVGQPASAPAGPALSSITAVPWLSPRRLGAASLAQDRDLGTALAGAPGSPPSPATGDGPWLLGTDPTETELRLEGFSLNDPVEGRAPWQLPVALWGDIHPHAGLGLGSDGDRGVAGVDLLAARARRRTSVSAQLGSGAGAGPGLRGGGPDDRVWTGFLEARAEAARMGGNLRGSLTVAPTRGPWQADPATTVARARRTTVLPALALIDGGLGSWRLSGVGLLAHERREHGRGGQIELAEQQQSRRQTLALTGLTARRPLGISGEVPAELVLRAGLLSTRRSERPLAGASMRTTGRRLTLASELSAGGHLGGRHMLRAAAGLESDGAERWLEDGGLFASRRAGSFLRGAEASSITPWVALDERYFPLPSLEIAAGIRLSRVGLDAKADAGAGPPAPDRTFDSRFLVGPRASVVFTPLRGRLRLHATGGRFGGRLPLAPLLDVTAAPPFGIDTPSEDAGMAGFDVRLWSASLSVAALERRLAHTAEDRFSPATGQLELFSAPYARRRYRALWAELRGDWRRFSGALVVLRSSSRGNHPGFLDAATSLPRPASSETFDTPAGELNREGPLPGDRRYGLRVLLEHGTWLTGALRLESAVRGRLDGGSPLDATALNPESPVSRVFLVERGSLGRTRAAAAVDLAMGLTGVRGGTAGWLRLEVMNVGNRRSVLARDATYTDLGVTPMAGARGRGALAGVVDGFGAAVAERAAFGTGVAWSEPLSARVVLGLGF